MKEEKLKERSIWRQFFSLSIPIAIANFLELTYSVTDSFWLGRHGSESLAAVSICYPIIFLVISLGVGLFVSGTVIVSRYKGRGDQEKVNYFSAQLIILMILVSSFLSILGYIFSPFLLKMIGAGELIDLGSLSYIRMFFLSTIFIFSFSVYQSLMRAVGNVKLPIFIILFTVLLNFIIDPILIFGFGPVPSFGVTGAAIATIFSEAINTFIALWLVLRGNSGIILKLKNFIPNLKAIIKILKIAIPSSMEQFSRSLGLVFITVFVVNFGVKSIAAYGIGGDILGMVMVISMSFLISTSILVGRNIGAGNIERAELITKSVAKMSFLVLTFLGLLIFIFAEDISRVFIPHDLEVIRQSTEYLKIMSLFFGFVGLQQIFNGAFNGAGKTNISMMLAILSLWVLRIPIAYILSQHTSMGFSGICWSFPIANTIAAFFGYIVFTKGNWKRKT